MRAIALSSTAIIGCRRGRLTSAAALTVLVAPLAARATAPDTCEQVVQTWARGCPALADQCIVGVLCPPRSAIVSVGCGPADRVRVEVSLSPHGFRQIGGLSASPIGDFHDWKSEPAGRQRAFDLLASCLARDGSLLGLPAAPPVAAPAEPAQPIQRPGLRAPGGIPWRLFVGLALLTGLALRRWRQTDRAGWTAVGLASLPLATFLFRRLTIPRAFFHQNGQGAYWIGFALESDGRRSPYGPGYWELFGWLARQPPDPEEPVFLAQAILGAAVPLFTWIIARAAGARPWLAGALALVAATSPILGRLAQSESYYAVCAFLLFAAGAALSLGRKEDLAAPGGRAAFASSILGAGLLIAQAARVVPACWLPAALLPLVLLVGRDPIPRSLARPVMAGAGIAVVVALLDGRFIGGVLHGVLGHQWMPTVANRIYDVSQAWPRALSAIAAALLPVAGSANRRRGGVLAIAILLVLFCRESGRVIWEESATVNRAFDLLWTPPLLALGVALVQGLRWPAVRTVAAVGGVAALLAGSALTWRVDTTPPTDVFEAQWAREWRRLLPVGATVIYAGQGPTQILVLPLYGVGSPVPLEQWVLTLGRPALASTEKLGREVYYYESSLCSTRDAGETCRDMRDWFELELLASRRLPGGAEVSGVPVALYRVRARRPTAAGAE